MQVAWWVIWNLNPQEKLSLFERLVTDYFFTAVLVCEEDFGFEAAK